MSRHNSAVFNNSCLRVPRNPLNKQPVPIYEQSYINDVENKVRKLSLESNETQLKMKSIKDYDGDCFRAFIDFFDSIPNYEDVNHLSNRDFYRKLEHLKEKQRTYYDYLDYDTKCEEKDDEWTENCKKPRRREKKLRNPPPKPKSSLKPFCATPTITKTYKHEEDESILSSDKEAANKPPSRRSVRIESPSEKFSPQVSPDVEYFRSKSRANISSASSKGKNSSCNDNPWDDITVDDIKFDESQRDTPLVTRSAPCSPNKSKQSVGWKDTITIPKPFQMTVRDEENQIIDEILANNIKPKEKKPDLFKAHPVPIESKIPLFDKIMAEQERRRQLVKKKSKANLLAQMRPFSFTQREEELQNLTKYLSRSTPSLYYDESPLPMEKFKAKPVPKNLFSNYVYKKMHEDEFYRALQKKIRAEEMLRAASLPPSMEKRERCKIKTAICARALSDFPNEEPPKRKNGRKKEGKPYDNHINELMREYLAYSPKSFRKGKKKRIKSSSSTTSRNTDTNRGSSSLGFDCLTRSNLAAVLRAQNTRKRLAYDMYQKLEEAKFKEELRWKEKMMRKKPVWGVLAFSHEEDLAMRLQMRRDEERMRNAEHRERMHSMLGRVNQQPTLYERQSMVLHKQEKYNKSKKGKLYKDRYIYSDSPKYSLSDCSEKRYLLDVKDEAVQADQQSIDDEDKCEYDHHEKEHM